MAPDLVIIGHVARDLAPDGWRPGGGAYYAAAQAQKLGVKVGVVTACSAETQALLPHGPEWHVVHSDADTTFENSYSGGVRQQRLLSVATPIKLNDIPPRWLDAHLVLLTPLFHEIEPGLGARLRDQNTLVAAGVQGWLRKLKGDKVLPGTAAEAQSWPLIDIIVASEEDLADPEGVAGWRANASIVVLTRGREGCSVWQQGRRTDLPAFRSDEVDPTGAGDVFAVAFLIRYRECQDAIVSARFAMAASALCVRGEGAISLGNRSAIETLESTRKTTVGR